MKSTTSTISDLQVPTPSRVADHWHPVTRERHVAMTRTATLPDGLRLFTLNSFELFSLVFRRQSQWRAHYRWLNSP